MSSLGIAAMAVIMYVAMRGMYQNKKKNIAIIVGSITVFASELGLVRDQASTVGDLSLMKAMIPHHSIAILTSERASIKDQEVKELANAIIEANRNEINEMKAMIKRLEDK
jgi:uncharacterized protein (DUF305 family)